MAFPVSLAPREGNMPGDIFRDLPSRISNHQNRQRLLPATRGNLKQKQEHSSPQSHAPGSESKNPKCFGSDLLKGESLQAQSQSPEAKLLAPES
ncbi:hypothetical protein MC885_013740 [Smutsia gigantea]|nr:hypothetical protein MC885_013740 [Smutsia gigantea]